MRFETSSSDRQIRQHDPTPRCSMTLTRSTPGDQGCPRSSLALGRNLQFLVNISRAWDAVVCVSRSCPTKHALEMHCRCPGAEASKPSSSRALSYFSCSEQQLFCSRLDIGVVILGRGALEVQHVTDTPHVPLACSGQRVPCRRFPADVDVAAVNFTHTRRRLAGRDGPARGILRAMKLSRARRIPSRLAGRQFRCVRE